MNETIIDSGIKKKHLEQGEPSSGVLAEDAKMSDEEREILERKVKGELDASRDEMRRAEDRWLRKKDEIEKNKKTFNMILRLKNAGLDQIEGEEAAYRQEFENCKGRYEKLSEEYEKLMADKPAVPGPDPGVAEEESPSEDKKEDGLEKERPLLRRILGVEGDAMGKILEMDAVEFVKNNPDSDINKICAEISRGSVGRGDASPASGENVKAWAERIIDIALKTREEV